MEKITQLLEICPDEVNQFINDLHRKKFPPKKKNKTMYPFKVLGKEYNNLVFTKNYIDFIKDISKIHPYEMFENCGMKFYMSRTNIDMKQSHKINENFYVTSYSSTDIKIKHIKEICELLGLKLIEL